MALQHMLVLLSNIYEDRGVMSYRRSMCHEYICILGYQVVPRLLITGVLKPIKEIQESIPEDEIHQARRPTRSRRDRILGGQARHTRSAGGHT